MSTCSIKIYKTKITPDRNAIIDDIEDYLSSLTPVYSNDAFQYLKMDLNIEIKIPVSQSYQNGDIGNYARIYQDNKIWYYAVEYPEWKGESTIALALSLDTLNTFSLGTDYVISNQTKIIRKHKSRYKKITGTPTTGFTMLKSIDKEPEGLSGLTKIRDNKEKIYTTEANATWLNKKWYLAYHNDTTNGYSCKLYPERDADIPLYYESGSSYFSIPTSQVTYFFTRTDNGNFKLELDGTLYNMDDLSLIWYYICFTYNTSTSKYDCVIGNEAGGLHSYTYSTVKILSANYYRTDGTTRRTGASVRYIASLDKTVITSSSGLHYFNTIDIVDRTDSAYIAIVECPYCPVLITWDSNHQVEENGWFSIDKTNHCVDFAINNMDLGLTLTDSLTSLFTDNVSAYASSEDMKIAAKRNKDDPKVLNSEITEFKYAYDNTSQTVALENINTTSSTTTVEAKINYKQTNQLSSERVFDISINDNNDNDIYTHIEDFDNIIFSNTNTQIPLITDNYISYMRNGYNYDKTDKNLSLASQYLSSGTKLVSGVGSLVNFNSSQPLSLMFALSRAETVLGSISDSIISTAQSENSLNKRINEARMTANSISLVNNIDLVDYYSGNKLYNYIYKPTANQISRINDLFFYCGYSNNQYGSISLAGLKTRVWFDYCQADVKFLSYNKAYKKYLDDIAARWNSGVTCYHCNTISSTKTWDWNREYENWENGFFSS